MAKPSKAVSLSDLRSEPAAILRRVRGSREPVVITERGRVSAVILSAASFARRERELEILRELARGEQEIQGGRGFTLSRVLKDGNKVLSRKQR
jgi:prevent-host-death family protein